MKYKYIQQYNYCDKRGVITVDFTFDFDRSLTKFDFSSLEDLLYKLFNYLFVICVVSYNTCFFNIFI